MVRHVSSRRALLAGLVFFLLLVGGSLLYRWHVHRTTEAALAETQRNVQRLKNDTAARTAQDSVETSPVDLEHSETNVETDDAQAMSHDTQVPSTDETSEVLDTADAFLPDDFVSEDAPAEDVPVSPFGFGPYPEVPADYPRTVMWHWGEEKRQKFAGRLKDMELIHRVLIKLWNQGDREWLGAKRDDRNGRVYPLYRNRIYINSWHEVPVKGGKLMRYPGGGSSAGSDWNPATYLPKFYESGGQLPDHIQFIDKDDAGYDPLTFLNLK